MWHRPLEKLEINSLPTVAAPFISWPVLLARSVCKITVPRNARKLLSKAADHRGLSTRSRQRETLRQNVSWRALADTT